ncbi:hypothetical protein BKP35_12355 [Anaerobacillus arseniciselenatis]|uniref:Uncharacterized protein n=1 Tax=Anaerobacillus arseniciselenatis TaxID=85682 RepID=A0A1S2LHW4_9BACI|nr:hypothetical protein [Anaerobacillus arseniciselenatis]OIJ11297.1 hypothetical protein BKP35_12355 [Anaerobacillus arseniciselenatis]
MTKRNVLLALVILTLMFISFEWIGFTNFKEKTMHHSTTTSGLVINKEVDENFNYYVYLNILDEKNGGTKEIKIVVPSENLWNLIELERAYFVVYQWSNNETPRLEQIEINDEFKETYMKDK